MAQQTALRRYTLEEMRKITGKTPTVVAKICNVTYRSLRNWESGATVPNVVNINDLLQIYGYTYAELDLTLYQKDVTHNDNEPEQSIEQPVHKHTIKEMRQSNNLTAMDVAKQSSITYHSLRNWETGANIPNILNIHSLLKLYGYHFNQLDLEMYYKSFTDRAERQIRKQQQEDNPLRERLQYEKAMTAQDAH